MMNTSMGEEKENKRAWELELKGLAPKGGAVSSGLTVEFLG